MHNLGVRAKFIDIAGDAIIETRPDGDQHITVMHAQIGLVSPMHAQHADELTIRCRKRTQAHQRLRDGIPQSFGKLDQLRRRIAQNDAAAAVNHRAPGGQNQIHRLLDLTMMTAIGGAIRAHLHRGGVSLGRPLGLSGGNVLGDIDQHRPGATGGGDVKRLFNDVGERFNLFDQEIVFHAGARDTDNINLLKRIVADQRGRHLPGKHHQRHRIHIRIGNAGDGIGRPGAGSDQHHTRSMR